MEPSTACLRLIKGDESCRLVAYPDPLSPLGLATRAAGLDLAYFAKVDGWPKLPGKPWTVGWGHTGPEVTPGLTVTQLWADHLFEVDVAKAASEVRVLTAGLCLTQGQMDGLTSLVYNCGAKAVAKSKLLRKLAAGDFVGAADEFLGFDHASGQVVSGLLRRRQAERRLFLYGG